MFASRSCSSILIVEDDREIRDSLRDILEMEGYRTLTAGNGKEALDMLETVQHPCLILLDLMMPVMNGWEFLKCHHKSDILATIPVVVVTATPEDRADSVDVQGLIKKPVDLDYLLKVVKRYCQGAAA